MPVNTIPYDQRPSASRGGRQGWQLWRNQGTAKKLYAGSNNIRQGREPTSKKNPWTPYKLPADWTPTPVTAKDASLDGVGFKPTVLPEADLDSALAILQAKTHSIMARRSRSNPAMWGGILVPEDMAVLEDPRKEIELRDKLACAPPHAPAGSDGKNGEKSFRRRAVVIDTESVQTAATGDFKGRQDLAAMCAVDFLTGEILFNVAVLTDRPVTHWITWINGIDARWYHKARENGNIVYGLKGAQDLLFKYIDADTVLVGHSFTNEQRALYLPHARVYDTQLECKQRDYPCKLGDAAPVSCQEKSHSALEDTLATRELALKFLGLGCYAQDDSSDGAVRVGNINWDSDSSEERDSTPGTSPERPAHSSTDVKKDGDYHYASDEEGRPICVCSHNPYEDLGESDNEVP